jgi:hypothetical protein
VFVCNVYCSSDNNQVINLIISSKVVSGSIVKLVVSNGVEEFSSTAIKIQNSCRCKPKVSSQPAMDNSQTGSQDVSHPDRP